MLFKASTFTLRCTTLYKYNKIVQTKLKLKMATALKKFLDEVPAGTVSQVQKELMDTCMTTRIIFRNWKLGLTSVPRLERSLMNNYSEKKFNKKIFEDEQQQSKTENG